MDLKSNDDILLEKASKAVRKSRRHHGPNVSIWHQFQHWQTKKTKPLNSGKYHLSPTQPYCIQGEWLSVWDTVVLKAKSMKLKSIIQTPICHDLKDLGSIKAFHRVKSNYHKVFKSDIVSYYASTNHGVLLNELGQYTKCSKLIDIFKRYMKRLEINHGNYHGFEQDIPKEFSLSPLMVTINLASQDKKLQNLGFYRRYMDDWIVFRRNLRKVIKISQSILSSLKLRMYPKKTFIGCIQKGFTFFGIEWINKPEIVKKTLKNHQ